MRTRILIWTILVVGPAFGQDKTLSVKTIESAKRAVVPIVCGAPQQDGAFRVNKLMGSGFFINDEGYFLTAGHVFDEWAKIDTRQGACFPAVYLAIGGWHADRPVNNVRWFKFETCTKSTKADIAISNFSEIT